MPQTLEDQIRNIEHDVLEMASRAELMFVRSMESLQQLDQESAKAVIAADDKVDQIDLRIERKCLELLSEGFAVGSDLRVIGTVLKLITDIERVADLAVDIARCAIRVDRELGESQVVDLPKIAEAARGMFHLAIEAYVRQDHIAVHKVIAVEHEVDVMFREIREQIHELMRGHRDDVIILSTLLIALHNIERIADHAVNIAERVEYMISDDLPRAQSQNG